MIETNAIEIDKITEADVERFRRRVVKADDDSGCLLWTGFRTSKGYGKFSLRGRVIRAHRFAFAVANLQPAGEMLVCHACDNPPCVNPAHLFAGTPFENAPTGNRHGSAKLTESDVRRFRLLAALQVPLSDLYRIGSGRGVTFQAVRDAVFRKTWRRL